MVWGAIAAAAKAAAPSILANTVSGAIGYGGAKETARMNRDMAREQMAFQERMSNSAYQRAADDMEAAGLNRILAIGSPATTPGGAAIAAPDFGSAFSQGMASGQNMMSGAQQISTQQQQEIKLIQEQLGIGIDNARKIVQTEIWQALGDKIITAIGEYNMGNVETAETALRAIFQSWQAQADGLSNEMELAWKQFFKKMSDKINSGKGFSQEGGETAITIKRGNDGVR